MDVAMPLPCLQGQVASSGLCTFSLWEPLLIS